MACLFSICSLPGRLTHAKKTESVISASGFPVRMKMMIGTEEIEIEFREAGSYNINMHINQ